MSFFTSYLRARLDPSYRYGLRVTLLALALILVVGPFGVLLREVTQQGALTEVDAAAATTLHEAVRRNAALVAVLKVITFLGSPVWFYLVLGGAALYLWLARKKRLAVYVAVTTLLGGAINSAVKLWASRPRPPFEDAVATAQGMSFPSGHAMASTVGYGVLLLVVLPLLSRRRRAGALVAYVVAVGLISFSRLALGVHYITDVVGGVVLGLAWLLASSAAFGIWRAEERAAGATLPEDVAVDDEIAERPID